MRISPIHSSDSQNSVRLKIARKSLPVAQHVARRRVERPSGPIPQLLAPCLRASQIPEHNNNTAQHRSMSRNMALGRSVDLAIANANGLTCITYSRSFIFQPPHSSSRLRPPLRSRPLQLLIKSAHVYVRSFVCTNIHT